MPLGWKPDAGKTPEQGRKLLRRILRAQPRLDGMAAAPHVLLRQRQSLAGGNPQHGLDDIDTGHHLGDGCST